MASVTYEVKGNGVEDTVDDQYVVDQLAQLGYNPQGMSPDGHSITLQDASGPYQITIPQALSKLGYEVGQVSVLPEAASFDNVSGELRAVVSKLPNDQMRQAAIEQTLQRMGIPAAQVMGSGRDWYYFDPGAGQYKALTNTPGWDRYDVLEGAMEAPRIVGSALGATGAAALSGGLAAPIGAAGGGALADTATRAILSQISPEFKAQAEENMGEMAKDIGLNAAVDAGTFGLAKFGGSAIGKMLGPNAGRAVDTVMQKGLISPTLKGAGTTMEGAGKAIAGGARALQNPFGRSVATMAIPGAAEAETLGQLARIPSEAIRNTPKLMQKLGSLEAVNDYLPKAGEYLRKTGQSLRKAIPTGTSRTEAMAAKMGLNLAEEAVNRTPTSGAVLKELANRAGAKNFSGAAETLGKGIDNLGHLGQGVSDLAQGVAGVGLKTAEAGGAALKQVGGGLRRAATLSSPLESRAAIQAAGDSGMDEYRNYLDRLRKERARSKINTILANN